MKTSISLNYVRLKKQAAVYKPLVFFVKPLVFISLIFISRSTFGQDYSQLVDTKIGSKGDGNTLVGATVPFGMVQFAPPFYETRLGFSVNQLSGAGCVIMGNFPLFPVEGAMSTSPNDMRGPWPNRVMNTTTAGYYAATQNKINCELTATKRTGMGRFTFTDETTTGSFELGSGVAGKVLSNASVVITGSNTVEGFADGGGFCGLSAPYKVYFAAEFDRNFTSSGTWTGTTLHPGSSDATGNNSGAFFSFDVCSNKTVQYKIGISYVSIENAKANLASENAGWDFDAVKASAITLWNSMLGRIEVSGGTENYKKQFYTALYHSLLHPSIFSDTNGQYIGPDNKIHTATGNYYSGWSNWDTYRTQSQLISLLAPDEAGDMITSIVTFAQQGGGGFPRWVMANQETGIMLGDPTSIIVANAWSFGAQNFDKNACLSVMRKGADEPGTISSNDQETRPDLAQYLYYGFTWSPSETLELTSSDFAIAQFARQAFGENNLYNVYLKRAQNWKNLYNKSNTWINARNQSGTWRLLSEYWTESTYKNYFWMVPYNLKTLIDTIGGKDAATTRLDELFVKLNAGYSDAWYASGNEPDFQVPWIYNWTGKPYKTQAIIRKIINEQFSSAPEGLPGNDDLGALSSWLVFAYMGLYPEIPGYGGFSINSPVFEDIKIHLKTGTIHITGGSPVNQYIQGMSLNSVPYNSTWLSFDDVKNGATINYTLGNVPDNVWGASAEPPSFNVTQILIPITSVEFEYDDLSVSNGTSFTLFPMIAPVNARNKNVVYTSDNQSIAKVDSKGGVIALSKGTTTITVTTEDGGKTASFKLTVTDPLSITARGEDPPYQYVTNLIDGKLTGKWLDYSPTSWVKNSYPSPQLWNTYDITSGDDAPERDPKDWSILGSNDGITWTTLDTRTGESWNARNQTKRYTFTNSATYTYYKWNITSGKDAECGRLQASEFVYSYSLTDRISTLRDFPFTVYPNPAHDQLTINLGQEMKNVQISILDMLGKRVYSEMFTGQLLRVDINGLKNGIYILKASQGNQNSVAHFVKND
jgi:predicted alpha-1,2-mannosidase